MASAKACLSLIAVLTGLGIPKGPCLLSPHRSGVHQFGLTRPPKRLGSARLVSMTRRITGTEFEEYVWEGVWLRRFPPSQGWESESQKPLAGSYRVDFAAWRANERAVGDAKDKGAITYNDVDKLIEDAGIFKAQRLILIVAADTEIPDGVSKYAGANGLEIIRTRWRA